MTTTTTTGVTCHHPHRPPEAAWDAALWIGALDADMLRGTTPERLVAQARADGVRIIGGVAAMAEAMAETIAEDAAWRGA